MNFDRLRFVAERAEVGEEREALFAVTIPEERGSFRRFCELIGTLPGGPRNVTEFNYRISDSAQAHVFVGPDHPRQGRIGQDRRQFQPPWLRGAGPHARRTRQGTHPPHGRRPLGAGTRRATAAVRFSRAAGRPDEIPFPHAPGLEHHAVSLPQPGRRLRPHPGRAAGAASRDDKAFQVFLDTLGYPSVEETGNPVYRLFLQT